MIACSSQVAYEIGEGCYICCDICAGVGTVSRC